MNRDNNTNPNPNNPQQLGWGGSGSNGMPLGSGANWISPPLFQPPAPGGVQQQSGSGVNGVPVPVIVTASSSTLASLPPTPAGWNYTMPGMPMSNTAMGNGQGIGFQGLGNVGQMQAQVVPTPQSVTVAPPPLPARSQTTRRGGGRGRGYNSAQTTLNDTNATIPKSFSPTSARRRLDEFVSSALASRSSPFVSSTSTSSNTNPGGSASSGTSFGHGTQLLSGMQLPNSSWFTTTTTGITPPPSSVGSFSANADDLIRKLQSLKQQTSNRPISFGITRNPNPKLCSLSSTAQPNLPYIPSPHPPSATPPTPPNWTEHSDDAFRSLKPYMEFLVDPKSKEYEVLEEMVSGSGIQINRIEQIVNPALWKKFSIARKDMLCSKSEDIRLLSKLGVEEKEILHQAHSFFNWDKKDATLTDNPYSDNMALLFHCTRNSSNLVSIYSEGLDERLGNPSGGLLGRGIYFADNPTKSIQYDGGTKVLLVFAVLLGDCIALDHTQLRPQMVREPKKSDSQKRNHADLFFDSIVARPASTCNEYVIYNRNQCCPVYAIHWKICPRNPLVISGSYSNNANPAGAGGGNENVYAVFRSGIPPLAWTSKSSSIAMPNGPKGWPYFARSIFDLMKGTQNDPDQYDNDIVMGNGASASSNNMHGTAAGTIDMDTATEDSEEILIEKLTTLCELGFVDDVKNRETLFMFNGNLDQAINHLLDEQNKPQVAAPAKASSAVANSKAMPVDVIDLTSSSPPASAFSDRSYNDGDGNPSSSNHSTNKPGTSKAMMVKKSRSDVNVKRKKTEEVPTELSDWILDMDMDENESSDTSQSGPSNYFDELKKTLEECTICTDEYESDSSVWKTLACSHKICEACYKRVETTRTTMSGQVYTFCKCPFCQGTSGIEIGTCPNGTMSVSNLPQSLPGYESCNTICIGYYISDGKYHLHRTAYLPNNAEGQEVLRLLQTAWDRRLCFTVGTSVTTGAQDTVVWNIHHKTSQTGGTSRYGYPDPTYLSRVKQELKTYGVE